TNCSPLTMRWNSMSESRRSSRKAGDGPGASSGPVERSMNPKNKEILIFCPLLLRSRKGQCRAPAWPATDTFRCPILIEASHGIAPLFLALPGQGSSLIFTFPAVEGAGARDAARLPLDSAAAADSEVVAGESDSSAARRAPSTIWPQWIFIGGSGPSG